MTWCSSLTRKTSWPRRILIVAQYFSLKLQQISNRSTVKKDPHHVETPSFSQVTINILVFLKKSKTLVFLWTPSNCETWIQQLLWDAIKLLLDILWTFNILNCQLTISNQTYIRYLFLQERGMVILSILRRNIFTERMSERNSCCDWDMSDCWKPGGRDGVIWFNKNSNCFKTWLCVVSFLSIVVQCFRCLLKNYFSVSLLWRTWGKRKFHQEHLSEVTLLYAPKTATKLFHCGS